MGGLRIWIEQLHQTYCSSAWYDYDYVLVYLGLVPKTDAYFLKMKFSIKDFFSNFGQLWSFWDISLILLSQLTMITYKFLEPYYTKSFLPIKLIDVNYLNECLSFELWSGGKVCKFLSLYRSPSHNRDELKTFLDNLELNFDHTTDKSPYVMVFLWDFNAKSNSWCTNDSTDIEGSETDILTSSFGFHQIINEATHILNNSPTCIDLYLCHNQI